MFKVREGIDAQNFGTTLLNLRTQFSMEKLILINYFTSSQIIKHTNLFKNETKLLHYMENIITVIYLTDE